jgi:hypothetical protein
MPHTTAPPIWSAVRTNIDDCGQCQHTSESARKLGTEQVGPLFTHMTLGPTNPFTSGFDGSRGQRTALTGQGKPDLYP